MYVSQNSGHYLQKTLPDLTRVDSGVIVLQEPDIFVSGKAENKRPEVRMVCLKHPDREAVAVCAACRKPVCGECLQNIDGANYCSEECYRRGTASKARADGVIRRGKKSDALLRRRILIWFIILLLLAGSGWFIYSKNQKKIDRKLRNVAKTVKKGAGKAINAGKGAMPQDSKYKREREAMVDQQ